MLKIEVKKTYEFLNLLPTIELDSVFAFQLRFTLTLFVR